MLAQSRLPRDRATGDSRQHATPGPDQASSPSQAEIDPQSPWIDEESELLGNARATDMVRASQTPAPTGLERPSDPAMGPGLSLDEEPLSSDTPAAQAPILAPPTPALQETPTPEIASTDTDTSTASTAGPGLDGPAPSSAPTTAPGTSEDSAEDHAEAEGPVGELEIPSLGGLQGPTGDGGSLDLPGTDGGGSLGALDLPGADARDTAVADACLAPLEAPAALPGPDGAVVGQSIDTMRASFVTALEDATSSVQADLDQQVAQVEQDAGAALAGLDTEVAARQGAARQAAQAEADAVQQVGEQESARATADAARDAASVRGVANQRASGYSDRNARKVGAVRDAIWSVHGEFSAQMTRNGAEIAGRARDAALSMSREILSRGEQYAASLGQDRDRVRAALLDVKGQTLAGLQALAARRLQQLAGIGEQAAAGFNAMEEAARNALADGASPEEVLQVVQPQQANAAAAAGAVRQSATDASTELRDFAAQGKAALEQAVGEYGAGLQRAIDEEASRWRGARQQFGTDLRARVDEGLQPNKQMLGRAASAMQEAANRAAEPFERSWIRRVLSGIGRAIFNFVVGLLALVVIAGAVFLAAVAAGLLAFTLSAFLAVLAAIGLVVLGVFFVLAVIQRTREYQAMGDRPWTTDLAAALGIAVVSLGDVFGVTPVLEGIAGSRAITGTAIDDPEVRAEMITGGLLMLATLGLARWGARRLPRVEEPILGPRANQMLGRSGRPQPTNVEPKFDLEFEQFVRDLEAGRLTEPTRPQATTPRAPTEAPPPKTPQVAPETAPAPKPRVQEPPRPQATEQAPAPQNQGPTRAPTRQQAPITPEEQAALLELRSRASTLRETYIQRPNPKGGNAAAAELKIENGPTLRSEATSKAAPMNRPNTRTQGPNPETGKGGHYEPKSHGNETHIRDADSEFKILSDLTDQMQSENITNPRGTMRLFTERAPCDSCTGIIQQFQARFPEIRIEVYFDIGVKGEPTPGHLSFPALGAQ